ncbi:alpha-glucosidase-like [Aphidius gifuensis]|uniref:alpha-glucosidase-like n=1 Tax=Aphidius gifuensis TaxID=684658 RepID=UPI001CDCC653|nr:alpha-glucosidase-like [Aphidius gifuensis]
MDEWWHNSFIYELYIRSFKDSNGDGVGDLNGVTSKLEYIKDLGISTVWITPFYKSPMIDFGYDITDFKSIDPLFGNFNDFDKLIRRAKSLNIKILLDFVPNHTSDQHPWFVKSIKRIKPYDDYYVWFDGKIVNGTRQPPTNWLSLFHGSAWTWNDQRQQYYYRTFTPSQPDLNFRNPRVNNEMKRILRFWLKKGVDGFRVDTIPSLVEGNPNEEFPLKDQKKKTNLITIPDDVHSTQESTYTYDPTGSYKICQSWSHILEEYKNSKKCLFLEVYFPPEELEKTIKYYNYGADIPMNVILLEFSNKNSSISELINLIDPYIKAIPKGKSPNWVYSNHDRSRVATKFGRDRADQMIMLTTVLPGIVVVYQGDEIGMEDRPTTWEETIDPPGCNIGPNRYFRASRDPFRTPFQWDDTTSAGFSTNSKTWLPVHENYKTLNLAAQKLARNSHYHIFKKVVALKKIHAIREGKIKFINVNEKVLIVIRYQDENFRVESLDKDDLIVLLINFTDAPININLADHLNVDNFIMTVYVASLTSHIEAGAEIQADNIFLPSAASVILTN